MLDVQREELPQAYLLILSYLASDTNDSEMLARALHRASRTSKPAVVVDLSLVDSLSNDVIELLLAYAFALRAQARQLILCHTPQASRHRFQRLDTDSQPLLVASVLDAIEEIEFGASRMS
ncbi:STAS domain-containing protein [Hymenobacter psychrophilus]|uniref:STAS domain-containing protein n=1 Tax=Hymenobacter psychrophilus TaxID=651662 RepID=A0A1H3NLM6_9BACT|nr:STAS domain-containing protein [Hymenobacter psychrophilus]SDY89109.1 hypothetical protein SAMN04488069_11741 [Hymenobacter psychrophilus]